MTATLGAARSSLFTQRLFSQIAPFRSGGQLNFAQIPNWFFLSQVWPSGFWGGKNKNIHDYNFLKHEL